MSTKTEQVHLAARLKRVTEWYKKSGDYPLKGVFRAFAMNAKSAEDVEESRANGYVTRYEDALFAELVKLLPADQQVWNQASYPADIATMDPFTGTAYVLEVDGSIHHNTDAALNDRMREEELVSGGVGVIRVTNSEVGSGAVQCAKSVQLAVLQESLYDGLPETLESRLAKLDSLKPGQPTPRDVVDAFINGGKPAEPKKWETPDEIRAKLLAERAEQETAQRDKRFESPAMD